MCWISKTLEKKIANEDIKVFKVGRVNAGEFISYYRDFKYEFNRLYRTDIFILRDLDNNTNYIFDGFHSYNSKTCRYVKSTDTGQWDVFFGSMFIDSINSDCSPVECTIPKHSEYYENEHGEIVSNQIIIKSVLEN